MSNKSIAVETRKSVGIWIRVSTEDQAQGDSPEHHEKRARMYAESKNWVVAQVYHLEAVSGKAVLQHAEAKRMIADVKRGHISGLIFSKLARLARNTKELLEIADLFQSLGVDLISLQESIDTSTPAGRLFYTMIAAMAQWEREEIAERVRASVVIRAKLQKPINGRLPFGYQWVNKRIRVHPEEAPVRRLIYELFDEQQRLKSVARTLNERGMRTRENKPFTDGTVKYLITDTSAKGIHRANFTQKGGPNGRKFSVKPEDQWVMTEIPAIVSEELWERCNALLRARAERWANGPSKQLGRRPVHLFAGLAFCECGKKMYVRYNSPNKYICENCRNKVPVEDLEAVYYDQLRSFFVSKEQVAKHLADADDHLGKQQSLLQTLESEQAKVKQEVDRVYDLYSNGKIDGDGFARFYKPLQERLQQLDEELPRLQAQVDLLKINHLTADQVLSEADDLYSRWPKLTKEEKRRVVESITEKIIIGKNSIDITLCHIGFSEELTKEQSKLVGSG